MKRLKVKTLKQEKTYRIGRGDKPLRLKKSILKKRRR